MKINLERHDWIEVEIEVSEQRFRQVHFVDKDHVKVIVDINKDSQKIPFSNIKRYMKADDLAKNLPGLFNKILTIADLPWQDFKIPTEYRLKRKSDLLGEDVISSLPQYTDDGTGVWGYLIITIDKRVLFIHSSGDIIGYDDVTDDYELTIIEH